MAAIVSENMKKSYGAIELVPGFNLHVEEREFTAFFGPSGCGKFGKQEISVDGCKRDMVFRSLRGLIRSPQNEMTTANLNCGVSHELSWN